MKSSMYRIELRRQTESYYLGVFLRSEEWGGQPYWMVEIPSDEPLVLWEFISESKVVIADWYARVWIFDVEKQELIFHKAFSTDLTGKAILSEDLKELHLIYENEDYNYQHAVVDLEKLEVVRDTLYADIDYVKNCERYKDKLFLYYADEEKGGWTHMYDIIDMKTGEYKKQIFDHPQFNNSDKRKPFIDHKNGKVLMPYYTEIEHREDPKAGLLLMQKIAIFDIETFELENIFPVREFPSREIDPDEYDGQQNAETIVKGFSDDDPKDEARDIRKKYFKAVHRFNRNLRSILFDDDGKTFWICWGAGAIRRMDYEGNMSKMYVKVSDMGDGNFSTPFEYNYNHIVHYSIHPDRFVFLDHSIFHQVFTEDLKGKDELTAKIDEQHPIEFKYIDEEDLPELDMPSNMIYKFESMIRFNMF